MESRGIFDFSNDHDSDISQKNTKILKDFFTRVANGMPAKIRLFDENANGEVAIWDLTYLEKDKRFSLAHDSTRCAFGHYSFELSKAFKGVEGTWLSEFEH